MSLRQWPVQCATSRWQRWCVGLPFVHAAAEVGRYFVEAIFADLIPQLGFHEIPCCKLGIDDQWKVQPLPPSKSVSTLDGAIALPDPPANAVGVIVKYITDDGAMNQSIDFWIGGKPVDSAHPSYGKGFGDLAWLFPAGSTGLTIKPAHPKLDVRLSGWNWLFQP